MGDRLCAKLAEGYATFWAGLGITHELTISLGFSPRSFSPEEQLMPILRNLAREAATKLRGLPKRKALLLKHTDPQALTMVGFYEPDKKSGAPFPHWHGGVALHPGEEPRLRDILWQCIGQDAEAPLSPLEPTRTTRPLIKLGGAVPTFHLTPLQTASRFITYANKNTTKQNVIHWTTADLLPELTKT